MQKAQLVFFPPPATGHIVSTLEFAKRLLEQYERLSVTILLIRPGFEDPTGDSSSPSQEFAASHPNIRFIDLPKVDPPAPELLKTAEKYISLYIESHKSHVKDAIVNHVISKSVPLAGLVVDFFCTSMIDVANELGVPSYLFFTSGAAVLCLSLYLPVRHSQTGRHFAISDADSIIPGFANPVPSSSLPSFMFNADAHECFVYHAMRFKEIRGIFVNTFAELEPHAMKSLTSESVTPAIYTIGPLLNLKGHKKSESDREKIKKWLDDQPPSSVVFLCFGSEGGFEPPQLAQIANALEQSGQRFLWAIRSVQRFLWAMRRPPPDDLSALPGEYTNFSEVLPEGFLERTENRGLVCGWAPQVEVLAHQAVGGFVSHCGWNSTLESIWYGVPMATWPMYAEQQINAFLLVKELEIAVELTLDYRFENSDKLVMADEIEKAIRSLMDAKNPVRKRVKELSEISRKAIMDGGSSFISMGRLIEDVLINNI